MGNIPHQICKWDINSLSQLYQTTNDITLSEQKYIVVF